jgi:metal-sulfur cluster biosynthetic enzyme
MSAWGETGTMHGNIECDFPADFDTTVILEQLAQVLDPELDEPIVDLGFVRSVRLRSGHADIALQLPTSWCAVNFAYLMAEEVRRALLTVEGVRHATISLGDHCAAREIEVAVNNGQSFAEAFPQEGAGSLAALRLTFLRKGFFIRQERLLRELRLAGCAPAVVCALRLGELSIGDDVAMVRPPGAAPWKGAQAATLQRYLERRAALGLDCSDGAKLIVDLEGKPFSADRLQAHYEAARTMRVALEANGSFCRALVSLRDVADALPSRREPEGREACTTTMGTTSL